MGLHRAVLKPRGVQRAWPFMEMAAGPHSLADKQKCPREQVKVLKQEFIPSGCGQW